ncbi:MarR family transcriptional regulator [Bacillaceae bacterium S4-13-58]
MKKEHIQELIDRYVYLSFSVTKKAEALITEQIGAELTYDQQYMLRYIKNTHQCTSTELAEVFDVKKSAITAIINRLAAKGLIERTRDEDDRRVVYLTLSKGGEDLFQRTEERVHCAVEKIIRKFDPQEIKDFLKTYEKLGRVLTEIKVESQEE